MSLGPAPESTSKESSIRRSSNQPVPTVCTDPQFSVGEPGGQHDYRCARGAIVSGRLLQGLLMSSQASAGGARGRRALVTGSESANESAGCALSSDEIRGRAAERASFAGSDNTCVLVPATGGVRNCGRASGPVRSASVALVGHVLRDEAVRDGRKAWAVGGRALPDASALGRAGGPARGCAVGVDAQLALVDSAVTHNTLTATAGITVQGGGLFTPLCSLRSVSTPMFARPPAWTVADPVVVVAVTRLRLMTLSLIVICSNAAGGFRRSRRARLRPRTSR